MFGYAGTESSHHPLPDCNLSSETEFEIIAVRVSINHGSTHFWSRLTVRRPLGRPGSRYTPCRPRASSTRHLTRWLVRRPGPMGRPLSGEVRP